MSFAINTKDGRLSVWVEGVSNCCYHPIPDDVAEGVSSGAIKWTAVVNAINKKRYMDKDFDWTSLRDAEDKLNVRTSKFEFAKEDAKPGDKDSEKSVISMSDVVGDADSDKGKYDNAVEGKKATAARGRSAKKDTPDIFDDGAPEEAK